MLCYIWHLLNQQALQEMEYSMCISGVNYARTWDYFLNEYLIVITALQLAYQKQYFFKWCFK